MEFSAMTGLQYAELVCVGEGVDLALLSAEPKNYGDARKRDGFQKWRAAECVEMKNCFDNGTFMICNDSDVPEGVKLMCHLIPKQIPVASREVRCKARLSCDGRFQCESTYSDIFAPTSRFSTLRAMCALAAQEDMKKYQVSLLDS